MMKAIVQTEYGSPDVLQLREVDRPVVRDDQMLVRVRCRGWEAAAADRLRPLFPDCRGEVRSFVARERSKAIRFA